MTTKPRILAVDDEERGIELVNRILRRTASIETATSGEAAWELFESSCFDLVISDQRMPGMSGVELLTRVAEHSSFTGRILLTGYADTVDTVEAINRARVHAYLSKPCPPDQLCLTVSSVLEQVETLRDNQRLADLLRQREVLDEATAGPSPRMLAKVANQLLDCVDRLQADAQDLEVSLVREGAREVSQATRILGEIEQVAGLAQDLLDPKRGESRD